MNREGWILLPEDSVRAWDDFVQAHSRGRFIHLLGFRNVVESVYKLKPNYWLYAQKGEIKAIFPSFFHNSLWSGKRIVSQPFSEYGGILFSPALEAGRKIEILAEFPSVIEKSRELGPFDYLELRCFPDIEGLESDLFKKEKLHQYGIMRLHQSLDLWNHVDYSVRKNIRRAISAGLTWQEANSEDEIRQTFYPLHLRSLKRLGSPPHPLSYFLELHRHLGAFLQVRVARHEQTPVSALLGWTVGKSVQITEIVSDERYFSLRANDLLHYEFIRWAVANGFASFDFGPVRYPGQRQYKKKWGIEVNDYCYYYFPSPPRRRPLSDQSRAARLAASLWQRLMPTRLAARIGKYLRKELSI